MSEFTYSTIIVRGADAFEFLQAQLTVDLNDLPDEPEQLRSVRLGATRKVASFACRYFACSRRL